MGIIGLYAAIGLLFSVSVKTLSGQIPMSLYIPVDLINICNNLTKTQRQKATAKYLPDINLFSYGSITISFSGFNAGLLEYLCTDVKADSLCFWYRDIDVKADSLCFCVQQFNKILDTYLFHVQVFTLFPFPVLLQASLNTCVLRSRRQSKRSFPW